MTRTPDEIKRGLFVCSDFEGNCPYCPYAVNGHRDPEGMCVKQLANDADRLIRQLEPQRDGLLRRVKLLEDAVDQWELVAASPGAVEDMARENAELLEKVEQLQAERDAVVETIKQLKRCADCKHATIIDDGAFTWVDCPKRDGRCSAKSLWEWRGVAEEE